MYEWTINEWRKKYERSYFMRHTFATRGLENGIELRVMQEILGHSDIKMTANLYTHVLPKKKKESIMKLKGMINF